MNWDHAVNWGRGVWVSVSDIGRVGYTGSGGWPIGIEKKNRKRVSCCLSWVVVRQNHPRVVNRRAPPHGVFLHRRGAFLRSLVSVRVENLQLRSRAPPSRFLLLLPLHFSYDVMVVTHSHGCHCNADMALYRQSHDVINQPYPPPPFCPDDLQTRLRTRYLGILSLRLAVGFCSAWAAIWPPI